MKAARIHSLVPVLVAAGVGLLAACGLPTRTCPTADLLAPVPASPADGAVVNVLDPSLTWTYPDRCVPEGYRVDLSVTADFSDTSLSGGTGDPSTALVPGEPLEDCTEYYWRVAPINGTTLGPFSPARTFRVDVSGTCAAAGDMGSISGRLWHDLCAASDGPAPTPLPEGCTYADGIWANGVMESGEPGLEGVVVRLGSGDCPAAGLASTLTGPDGEYSLTGLAAGPYCVSIDALEPPNDSILIPGGWTHPPALTTALAWDPVTLGDGEHLADVNFGWDYQFLPAPEPTEPTPATATPTAEPTAAVGRIGGRIWNDICHFTGGVAGEPLVLGSDCVGDPLGVWGANGLVDPGEPPFANVTFRLGAGPCPSPAYAAADSNSAGYFMFINLPAGTYCVMLNPLTDGNDTILIPGGPSNYPVIGGEVRIEIDLAPGEDALWISIGWEFQHLG